jgi:hypothetical protein
MASNLRIAQILGTITFWGYPVDSRTHYMLFLINDSMNGYLMNLRSPLKRFIPSPLMGEG